MFVIAAANNIIIVLSILAGHKLPAKCKSLFYGSFNIFESAFIIVNLLLLFQ